MGVIEKLGSAVQGYAEGQRVIAGAICPNFNSYAAQDGAPSQDGSYLISQGLCGCHGFKATAGWRFGNLIDGAQAEYVLVPGAQANFAPIPDGRTDEQVLMSPDIMKITGGRGVDASIEALGTQATFEAALRVLKPGGTLSSLGVYSSDLTIPLGAFAAGLGDHRIVIALCPGGKERMRRLMNVVASGRIDLSLMVTHQFKLDDIVAA